MWMAQTVEIFSTRVEIQIELDMVTQLIRKNMETMAINYMYSTLDSAPERGAG